MGFQIQGTPTEVKATGENIEAVQAPVPQPTEPPKAEEKKAEE